MRHVKQIREIIDAGRAEEAHGALDELLSLGPSNTEALKLRARLYEFEGRFAEEAKIWDKVSTIDREDPDAVAYYLRKQLEDREHFYFTDDVPGGGRRFMAYPRRLVNTSAVGLLGCFAFLLSTRLAARFPLLGEPMVMLGLFGFFVMLPWVGILITYFGSMKAVVVSAHGISVATRLRAHTFRWTELERICLARSTTSRGNPALSLVLLPKEGGASALEIDLNHGSTAIRARSYLIREIARLYNEPEYLARESIELGGRKTISY